MLLELVEALHVMPVVAEVGPAQVRVDPFLEDARGDRVEGLLGGFLEGRRTDGRDPLRRELLHLLATGPQEL